ncbi:MAG: MarR family EPS-associated transcriptional regulator [Gammaproteobacteria bacterium]|nr:MarR family EPS-associated transcriptional regulator [Gammaproteobacteria bacterium]
MDDAIRYRLLKLLDEQSHLTQRELAMAMGVSLGKINYCLRALIDVGVVKANNFRNSSNKSACLYALTPHGIEEKARVTHRFLLSKLAEYEAIRKEIEELQNEMKEEKRFAS